MLTNKVLQMVEIFIKAKVLAKEEFTAYDITKLVRQGGERVKHDEIRALVHEEMDDEYGNSYTKDEYFTHPTEGWTAIKYMPISSIDEDDEDHDSDLDPTGGFYVRYKDKDKDDDNIKNDLSELFIPKQDTIVVTVGSRYSHKQNTPTKIDIDNIGIKDYIKRTQSNVDPHTSNGYVDSVLKNDLPNPSKLDKNLKPQTQNRISIPKRLLKSYFGNKSLFLYSKDDVLAISPVGTNRELYKQAFNGPLRNWNHEDDIRLTLKGYTGAKISMYDPKNEYVLVTLY